MRSTCGVFPVEGGENLTEGPWWPDGSAQRPAAGRTRAVRRWVVNGSGSKITRGFGSEGGRKTGRSHVISRDGPDRGLRTDGDGP